MKARLLLCLSVLCYPAVRAKLPPNSGGIQTSITKIVPINKNKSNREETDSKTETEEDRSYPATPTQHTTSSAISIGLGGSTSIIQKSLGNIKSAAPILRGAAFFAQFVIIGYISHATWKILKEAFDEVNEEFAAARRSKGGGLGGSYGDVREEQDMPYAADDNSLDGGLLDYEDDEESSDESDEEENKGDSSLDKRRQRNSWTQLTPQMTATRELALRLRSAGIDDSRVASIVKSLTRAEGNVLTQTLLSPMDGGGVSNIGSSPEAATAAWNDIGGLSDAKESLLDLAFPLTDSENNNYYGGLLHNPLGVLLYGPPGCGKTMLVRALAATVGARFLTISPSCLLRKYVGETNLNVRALFSVARKISPCVLFVDELDGLFRERGGEDHDVSRDLKTEFLQLWDGIRNHAAAQCNGSVLVIGASNRPFDVDPAFLRRMPRRIFVGLPDYDSRISILQRMLQNVPLDTNFDLHQIASRLGGYSPSDIREALQAAALYPLREARAEALHNSQINTGQNEQKNLGHIPNSRIQMPALRKLRTGDVLRALQFAKPTHFSKKYQRELMKYVHHNAGRTADTVASPSVSDRDDNYIADAGTFSGDYLNQEDSDDSDSYSYDESDSDYDEL